MTRVAVPARFKPALYAGALGYPGEADPALTRAAARAARRLEAAAD